MADKIDKIKIGRRGEKLAWKYLKKKGCRRLAQNYRIAQGEIDLIVQDGTTVAFVEVKTRHSEEYTPGENVVNHTKRKHLTAAARHFIRRYDLENRIHRFDIVVVILPDKGRPSVRHWPGAFPPTT